ncbi:MAG: exodeoxyribonuclease VII large subunit [Planctomycetota bacterium]
MATDTTAVEPVQQTLTVSQLTARIKGLMEDAFPDVWVAGEVSNFSRPASGHCYFTLKDEHAQVRAVVWRGSASRLKFDLIDGLEIICHGRLDVYGPRGSYQLVIDQAQPQGLGALELALRQLRERLGKEGLFDADRKQPLPAFPRRIGFVTSPTGAAVRDFLEVARRRWLGVEVLVIPARVQGEGAAEEVAAGIHLANRIKPALDALVVGRGGGSMEDLWAFNEEPVIRALAASQVPTVSAVGHEIDVTLADMAADVRALTPSEAAERVVPSAEEVGGRLASLSGRLDRAIRQRFDRCRGRLDALAGSRPFVRPYAVVHDARRALDELESAMTRAIGQRAREHRQQLERLAGKLESLSPLGVLARGYSLTQDRRGRVVRSADQLATGDEVSLRFGAGSAEATINQTHK